MGNIIGLCGRMRSGKGELANICVKYDYERLYFALPLKELCSKILGISIEELNKLKNDGSEISLAMTEEVCGVISHETDIPLDIVKNHCLGNTVKTVRDMLQFIGTDLIRQYNYNWHVNKIMSMIDKDKDYVLDDVRFPNEKAMIDELGGDSWFVVRPTIDNVSNHISETSLTWKSCGNKVILNDSTLSNLLFKWENIMYDYKRTVASRDKEYHRILENSLADTITPMSEQDCMFLGKALFKYKEINFDKDNIFSIIQDDRGDVIVTPKHGSPICLTNPLNIEDIKILL